MQLLWFGAEYPSSFFGFGHPRKTGHYKSFLLRNKVEDYENNVVDSIDVMWRSNAWTQLCFSYDSSNKFVRVVKVSN